MPSTIAKTPTGIGRAGTQVWTEDDGRYCRLYDTIIAKLKPLDCQDDEFERYNLFLDLSFNSPTTRRRVAQVTNHWLGVPVTVWTRRGKLYVSVYNSPTSHYNFEVGRTPRLTLYRKWGAVLSISEKESDFNK